MASAAMTDSLRKRPGGRYAEWTDAIPYDAMSVPPVDGSSTRVITEPLPRAEAMVTSRTTTVPFGRRVEGHPEGVTSDAATQSGATGTANEAAGPTSSGRSHAIDVQADPEIDTLLVQLPSPLDTRADGAPDSFAVSAGPAAPQPSRVEPQPVASVLVNDSVLRGKVGPRAAPELITATASRRAKERRDENAASTVRRQRRQMLIAFGAVGTLATIACVALGLRGTRSPSEGPAVEQHAVATGAPSAARPTAPIPLPSFDTPASEVTESSEADVPSPHVDAARVELPARTVFHPPRPDARGGSVKATPSAAAKPTPSPRAGDDYDTVYKPKDE